MCVCAIAHVRVCVVVVAVVDAGGWVAVDITEKYTEGFSESGGGGSHTLCLCMLR